MPSISAISASPQQINPLNAAAQRVNAGAGDANLRELTAADNVIGDAGVRNNRNVQRVVEGGSTLTNEPINRSPIDAVNGLGGNLDVTA